MTMGEYIKKLRSGENIYGRKWSQEELGAALKPPVNRAAVNKWETGLVENLKRTHIQQLAEMFGVSPCDLMCFDDQIDSSKIAEEVKLIEAVQGEFGKDAVLLLQYFNELNENGKQKALKDISDLADHPKYAKDNRQMFDC
jgi:transcriptional regulator with XRE-family HTH domain